MSAWPSASERQYAWSSNVEKHSACQSLVSIPGVWSGHDTQARGGTTVRSLGARLGCCVLACLSMEALATGKLVAEEISELAAGERNGIAAIEDDCLVAARKTSDAIGLQAYDVGNIGPVVFNEHGVAYRKHESGNKDRMTAAFGPLPDGGALLMRCRNGETTITKRSKSTNTAYRKERKKPWEVLHPEAD